MNANEIVQRIDAVLELCQRAEAVLAASMSQGRMASLEEARTLDGLSRELTSAVGALSPHSLAGIGPPGMRSRAEAVLGQACRILQRLAGASGPVTVQRAASSCLAEYHAY